MEEDEDEEEEEEENVDGAKRLLSVSGPADIQYRFARHYVHQHFVQSSGRVLSPTIYYISIYTHI